MCRSKKIHMWNSLVGRSFSFWDSFQTILFYQTNELGYNFIWIVWFNLKFFSFVCKMKKAMFWPDYPSTTTGGRWRVGEPAKTKSHDPIFLDKQKKNPYQENTVRLKNQPGTLLVFFMSLYIHNFLFKKYLSQ